MTLGNFNIILLYIAIKYIILFNVYYREEQLENYNIKKN